jgi:hypothetical protein
MKGIPTLRHLRAHRYDLARDVAGFIHRSAWKVDSTNFAVAYRTGCETFASMYSGY